MARRKKVLGDNPLETQRSLPNVVEQIVSDRSDTPTPRLDDAELGAAFVDEVEAFRSNIGKARVRYVTVKASPLVQFDGEHAVDRLIEMAPGSLQGAIVKVAPIVRASFRDAFDAAAVAQSARERGAVAVLVQPRIVPDTRIEDRKAEAVRSATSPRAAIATWFGELAGLTPEDRQACIDAAEDLIEEDGQ